MIRADKTFVNANIYTMEKPGERAEAAVVYRGEFVFVGDAEEALKYPTRETVDLGGKTVLPGFTDTHIHLISDCQRKDRAELGGAQSIAEIVQIMKDYAEKSDGEWLTGANLHIENIAEGRFPNRYELDEISKERPVILFSYCLHIQIVNSEGLRRGGIVRGFKPEIEGLVEFFDDGEPNGIIREDMYARYFSDLVERNVTTTKGRQALLRKYMHDYTARGITSVQAFSALADNPLEYVDEYFELDRVGELPLRVTINSSGPLDEAYRAVSGFGNDKIRIGAKKLFSDGSLNARAAALFEPYSDDPGNVGLVVNTQEEIFKVAKEAYYFGCDVAIHAIGDRGIDIVIGAIEKVLEETGYSDEGVASSGPLDDEPDGFRSAAARKYSGQYPRFRIIHTQLVTRREQIERLKRLPVILDMQPIFVRNWYTIADERIGPERKKGLFAFRTLIDNGLLLTGGSDAPVETADPLLGIQIAVTRKTAAGEPPEGFVPEEALSVFEAASLYTRNAAYCTHEEDRKGTIKIGRLADFIVLDRDIFEVDPLEIAATQVVQVYLGGERIRYIPSATESNPQ
ncbi:MAG: amidohydrolase [Clostridiales Family XIII bacterium]|jgi:predicted amidohydrolase YtcJ|nr:amidohydrolase [Clostridiales Family XIII bacterium]